LDRELPAPRFGSDLEVCAARFEGSSRWCVDLEDRVLAEAGLVGTRGRRCELRKIALIVNAGIVAELVAERGWFERGPHDRGVARGRGSSRSADLPELREARPDAEHQHHDGGDGSGAVDDSQARAGTRGGAEDDLPQLDDVDWIWRLLAVIGEHAQQHRL